MKIYKIQNIEEYVKLIFFLLEGGSEDSMELEEPFFKGVDEVFNFFNIQEDDIDIIYGINGEELWNVSKETLPTKWLIDILKPKILLKYPFYIVTDDTIEYQIFNLIQNIEEV